VSRVRSLLERPIVAWALIAIVLVAIVVPWLLALAIQPVTRDLVGIDANIYFNATDRWLADGTWYLPRQLNGPYAIEIGDVLYPPILLWILLPFEVLPAALWWAIPLAITALALVRIRPPRWSIALLLLCLAWGPAMAQLVKGNPVMWIMAALTVSVAFGWPSTLVLVKPSLFPFALLGIRRRSWWVQLAVLGVLSLPVLGLTLLYPQVILDSRGGGLLYSLNDVPLLVLPVLAGLAAGKLHLPSRARPATAPAPAAPEATAVQRPDPAAGAG
jgi:hypothetical protein